MKKNYRIKRTISIKRLISDYGKDFSEDIKKRLLDLEVRCVLTRVQNDNKFDLKHVEHTKYDCVSGNGSSKCKKEHVYGKFIVNDEMLYFSDECTESNEVMKVPLVNEIYNSLNSEEIILDEDCRAKKVDDSNIDYIIDSILTVCPEVSQRYIDIVREMKSIQRD
ncbi:hypothetical protein ACFIJ5_08335 [Haloimpatiens sp. FM7330]|uniref:hypothetical protein n=1 Tax=Haloimpatiens sp. FM7330 TaxID=3298610 RepID=UPI003628907A